MISRKEIENLAELSRLQLDEEEMASLEKEFSAILEYVGQIRSAATNTVLEKTSLLHNVMRDDRVGGTPESSPEKLLAAAPHCEDNYIVVRKIIERNE